MEAADVVQVLDALDGSGVRHWVAGGWGVAALAGRQARWHRDLDLAVDAAARRTSMAGSSATRRAPSAGG